MNDYINQAEIEVIIPATTQKKSLNFPNNVFLDKTRDFVYQGEVISFYVLTKHPFKQNGKNDKHYEKWKTEFMKLQIGVTMSGTDDVMFRNQPLKKFSSNPSSGTSLGKQSLSTYASAPSLLSSNTKPYLHNNLPQIQERPATPRSVSRVSRGSVSNSSNNIPTPGLPLITTSPNLNDESNRRRSVNTSVSNSLSSRSETFRLASYQGSGNADHMNPASDPNTRQNKKPSSKINYMAPVDLITLKPKSIVSNVISVNTLYLKRRVSLKLSKNEFETTNDKTTTTQASSTTTTVTATATTTKTVTTNTLTTSASTPSTATTTHSKDNEDFNSKSPVVHIQENGDLLFLVQSPWFHSPEDYETVCITVTATLKYDEEEEIFSSVNDDCFDMDRILDSFPSKNASFASVQTNFRTKSAFQKHHSKNIKVLKPPTLELRQSFVGHRRMYSLTITNTQEFRVVIKDMQVYMVPDINKMIRSLNADTKQQLTNALMMEMWKIVIHDSDIEGGRNVYLEPHESHCYVVSIEPSFPTSVVIKPGEPLSFSSKVSFSFSSDTLHENNQNLTCHYELPHIRISFPEFSISVSVPEIVYAGTKFGVTFVVENAGEKTRDVSLILQHQPRLLVNVKDKVFADIHGVDLPDEYISDADRLQQLNESKANCICLDETVYLGRVEANTSKLAVFDFMAFDSGTFEIASTYLYDHGIKAFLPVRSSSALLYVLDSCRKIE